MIKLNLNDIKLIFQKKNILFWLILLMILFYLGYNLLFYIIIIYICYMILSEIYKQYQNYDSDTMFNDNFS